MTTGPWRPLSRRAAGLGADETLVEGVPVHMLDLLQRWAADQLLQQPPLRDEVQLRLGLPLVPPVLSEGDNGRYLPRGEGLLDLIDAILRWHPDRSNQSDAYTAMATDLERILQIGRSVWRITGFGDGLERRIDDTVTEAATQAETVADPQAADHLRAAWAAAFGLHPDPDTAYREAVRAVEAVACPLIGPTPQLSTLGTVIAELRQRGQGWELVLPDRTGQPRDVTHLIGMMELLWHGQVSRHAGSAQNRRQTPAEAQAAVCLAVTLVQWLRTDVLRRRGTAGGTP